MAYRAELDPRSRSGAIIAVVAVHAALLFALLYLPGKIGSGANQSVLRIFDVITPPPPPTPPRRPPEPVAKHKPGGSAPANIKSEATQIVAPKTRVETPPIQAVPATETPREGTAPTEGQSNVGGPGTGSGGNGSGTGNGSGMGEAVALPAALIRGISGHEYPEVLQRSWPRGGIIYVRLRVEPNGRPSRCDVMRSFGDPMADQWTCALLMQRSEFRPALNARGVPIAAWFGYKQVDIDR